MLGQSPLARRLEAGRHLSQAETAWLDGLCEPSRALPRRATIVADGTIDPPIYVLLKGWAATTKEMPDGRRQIINFALPGDLLGLRDVFERRSHSALVAITDITVSELGRQTMLDLFRARSALADSVAWALSQEQILITQHLVSLGRRDAVAAMAHLMLELWCRLAVVGLTSDGRFTCPLTHDHLADALGLSPVHVNRVLRQLHERQLMHLSARELAIHDFDTLAQVAGFDLFDAIAPNGYGDQLPVAANSA